MSEDFRDDKIITKELLHSITDKDFFSIAKIIDNCFIGTFDTFSCAYINGKYYLTTNRCDEASCIRIYDDGKIERIAGDTDGYEEIQKTTYENIFKWLLERIK